MLPAHTLPISQADLLRLDSFLHSSACGRDAMGLSHAHGFLTAAASGPERLDPDEWLRLVFDEPVFADGEQAEIMLGLALRLYQEIEQSLREPGSFRPVLDHMRNRGGALTVDATAWCQGYFSGMSLCREHWALHGGRVLDGMLAPIIHLSRPGALVERDQYAVLCDALPAAAQAVYRYWRAQDSDDPRP